MARLDPLRAWARPRLRVLGSALGAGFAVGVAVVAVLPVVVGAQTARTNTFAVGALLLGFGTLGWSGSAMAGRGIENAQRYMDIGSDWSEDDSRRAMTRVGSFGAGLMLAVPLVTAVRGM